MAVLFGSLIVIRKSPHTELSHAEEWSCKMSQSKSYTVRRTLPFASTGCGPDCMSGMINKGVTSSLMMRTLGGEVFKLSLGLECLGHDWTWVLTLRWVSLGHWESPPFSSLLFRLRLHRLASQYLCPVLSTFCRRNPSLALLASTRSKHHLGMGYLCPSLP